LADEATALLHGRDCLEQMQETVETMFKGEGESTDGCLGYLALSRISWAMECVLADQFMDLKLATSRKKDARRLIAGGGAKTG
jgi:tyrosyl-tRNA synthetase